MRLSMQDKNEFLKAAVKAGRARDLDGLITWVVSAVEAIDSLPEGKADAACPPYQEQPRSLFTTAIPYSPPVDYVPAPILPVPMGPAPDNGIRGYPVPGRDAR